MIMPTIAHGHLGTLSLCKKGRVNAANANGSKIEENIEFIRSSCRQQSPSSLYSSKNNCILWSSMIIRCLTQEQMATCEFCVNHNSRRTAFHHNSHCLAYFAIDASTSSSICGTFFISPTSFSRLQTSWGCAQTGRGTSYVCWLIRIRLSYCIKLAPKPIAQW